MKKKLLILSISVLLMLSSCSAIPGAKPAVPKTAAPTAPTIIERIQAIESQEVNWNAQIAQALSVATSLQSKIDSQDATITELQAQIEALKAQIKSQNTTTTTSK